jgi:Zn-dependent protease/CBS domain-containing protein
MREYDVARVWGIPIRVHISLLVILPILAYLIGSGEQIGLYAGLIESLTGTSLDVAVLRQGNTPWLIGSVASIALFVSVLLHELGHAWMAMRYDLDVESITLWILGGLANLGSIPREWKKEFWIAVAGPIVSVATGVVCYLALFAVPASADVTTFVVGWLAVTNLTLAVFNMLPAFPMDGGRVLRALLARNRPYVAATRTAARIGSMFAILFAVVGILPPIQPMFLLLALFIYGAANSESRMVALSDLLEGVTVGELASGTEASIDVDATVDDLVSRMFADRRTQFVVTENGTPVGVVSAVDFKALSPEERATTTVDALVERDLPRFEAGMAAFDALIELDGNRTTEALVEDAAGTRVITRADFAAAMEMRRLVGTHEPF